MYDPDEEFSIGGCKVVRQSDSDAVTVIGAGVTLFEALAAYDELQKEGINIRVIDLYSVKPVDAAALTAAAKATKAIITVEDHYPQGGIGEAVLAALASNPVPVHILAVTKKPKSGKPAELLDFEGISRKAIVKLAKEITGR
jgi:transketolase